MCCILTPSLPNPCFDVPAYVSCKHPLYTESLTYGAEWMGLYGTQTFLVWLFLGLTWWQELGVVSTKCVTNLWRLLAYLSWNDMELHQWSAAAPSCHNLSPIMFLYGRCTISSTGNSLSPRVMQPDVTTTHHSFNSKSFCCVVQTLATNFLIIMASYSWHWWLF